jgi:hypothetical protein
MERESVVVPATIGPEVDTDGRLAYDRISRTLYVVWRRGTESTEIVFAALAENGEWSAPKVLATAPGYKHADLKVLLTRGVTQQNEPVTFLHALWWKESQVELIAEYALAALDGSTVLSTSVSDLASLSGLRSALDATFSDDGIQPRVELEPTYPPLAMAAAKEGIDVVFGSKDKKSFTRLTVIPRQVQAQARLFIPGGKGPVRVPYTRIHNSIVGQVTTDILGGRVIVYATASDFRYATFENGTWSTVRSLRPDAAITAERLAIELRRHVEDRQQ